MPHSPERMLALTNDGIAPLEHHLVRFDCQKVRTFQILARRYRNITYSIK